MANNYAQGTFEPEIPFDLLTESDLNLLDAFSVSVDQGPDGLAYTHRPNEGVECQCDFNTKAQAVEFARALAGRTGIPVYGNLCNIDDGGAA